MFTPGDNDWTDCDRASAGAYDSNERLAFEREVLFSTPFSLGQRKLRLEVQHKPFLDAQGRRLENFTRVETFGDHQENGNNDVHWLEVTVDPASREVFAYQPQIVPANRTAVPGP